MSEAKARAEARKKKILERGSDRMAIATGQKASTGSSSWRRKKQQSTSLPTTVDESQPSASQTKELQDITHQDNVCTETMSSQSPLQPDPRVEEVDDDEAQHHSPKPTSLGVENVNEEPLSERATTLHDDSVLDKIIDDIDISTLLSAEELKAKEESSKRVLLATKDFDPMEREKSIAKRKSVEQEIARQTEEFDRLTALSQRKSNKKKEDIVSSNVKSEKVEGRNKKASSEISLCQRIITSAKKCNSIKVARCFFLVIMGSIVGFWSSLDTDLILSMHPTTVSNYMTNIVGGKEEILSTTLSDKMTSDRDAEIVEFLLPTEWREQSSLIYIWLHYPFAVVMFATILVKFLFSRFAIKAENESGKGGLMSSLVAIAMGDFSGITSPISAFLGEVCIYAIAILVIACTLQHFRVLRPDTSSLHSGDEF